MSTTTTGRVSAGADVRDGRRTPAARKDPTRKLLVLFAGYAVLVTFSVIYIYPFLIQIATSFKTRPESTASPLSLVPDPFTTEAFQRLTQTDFPLWFANSVIITIFVTAGRVFFNSLAGYALARIKFKGRDAVFTAILAVLAVPGVILLIPKFLVLNSIGIYDTYPALIVPLLVDAAGVFIMKQFFENIPVSVEEAARIDGASTFRIFWSVVLPMARPALITITILSFQGSWNELPHYIVAAQDPALSPLTKGVATLLTGQLGSGNEYPLSMAAALLMTVPVAIVFFSLQRYFVRGGTAGAEKG
jgi:multiple sugar transport system permease protein